MYSNITMMLRNLTTPRQTACSAQKNDHHHYHFPDLVRRIDEHRTRVEEYRKNHESEAGHHDGGRFPEAALRAHRG